jgi:hypothetical protein
MENLTNTLLPVSDVAERPPNPDLFNLVCELGVLRQIGNPPINEGEYRDVLNAYHAARNNSKPSAGRSCAS